MRTASFFERAIRGGLLILDTGPIRELVSFHAVDQFGFGRLRADLLFLKDTESYQTCGEFIASFRQKTTSASVVAELNYWIRKTDPPGQIRLWNRVYDEFRRMGMNEEVVRLVEMHVGLVTRFGPVDVSLIELARRHASLRPVILTTETRGFYDECVKAGLRIRAFRN